MKKVFLKLFFASIVSFVFITGCNKENEDFSLNNSVSTGTDDAELKIVTDNADANLIFNNVADLADEAYYNATGYKSSGAAESFLMGGCATVSLDTISNPHILTIDFGEENCLCADGRYRRGKIIVTFTGKYRKKGTVITHSFDNYFVNDNELLGSVIVTNTGRDDYDNINFLISSNAIVIKADSSGQITRVSNLRRIWIEGEDTPERIDDVYLIKGKSYGQLANGNNYKMIITNPLRKEIGCKYFVSGTFNFKPENKPLAIFDYGDGECDNIATVTINGETHTIYLP